MDLWIYSHIFQWVMLILLIFVVYHIAKSQGHVLLELKSVNVNGDNTIGPSLNQVLPPLDSISQYDKENMDTYLAMFFSTGCGYCMNAVNELESKPITGVRMVAFIKNDGYDEFEQMKEKLEASGVMVYPLSSEVFNTFVLKGFPFAVYIHNQKVKSKGPATSRKALEEVLVA